MELSYRMRGALSRVAKLIREHEREDDRGVLRDFGELVTQVDAVCAIADQFLDNRIRGLERVGDASIVKNSYSRALRAYSLLCLRLGGMNEQSVAPLTSRDPNNSHKQPDYMNTSIWN